MPRRVPTLQAVYEAQRRRWRRDHPLALATAWTPPPDDPRYVAPEHEAPKP